MKNIPDKFVVRESIIFKTAPLKTNVVFMIRLINVSNWPACVYFLHFVNKKLINYHTNQPNNSLMLIPKSPIRNYPESVPSTFLTHSKLPYIFLCCTFLLFSVFRMGVFQYSPF